MMSSALRPTVGSRAFGTARPRAASHVVHAAEPFHLANAYKSKKRNMMVEVEVAEDEPEDVAVRRYMKLVMDSRVLENLRGRKVKESKIEAYKRRFRERVELRKAGFVEPTYDELYGSLETRPFDDFFTVRDEKDPEGPSDGMGPGAEEIFGSFGTGGTYVDTWSAYTPGSQPGGSYIGNNYGNTSNWQGGYMTN